MEHSNAVNWRSIRIDLQLALFGAMFCLGKFFETLIGVRKQPLGELLAKLGAIYVMEPALTVLFVTNMVHVWENVMANLRSQVFRRILIQKVLSSSFCCVQLLNSHLSRLCLLDVNTCYVSGI